MLTPLRLTLGDGKGEDSTQKVDSATNISVDDILEVVLFLPPVTRYTLENSCAIKCKKNVLSYSYNLALMDIVSASMLVSLMQKIRHPRDGASDVVALNSAQCGKIIHSVASCHDNHPIQLYGTCFTRIKILIY